MFVDLSAINAEDFTQAMAKENVLIRGVYQDYYHWSRVSVGTLADIEKYTTAMPKGTGVTDINACNTGAGNRPCFFALARLSRPSNVNPTVYLFTS